MPKCPSCGHPNPSNPNPTGNERCEQCGELLSAKAVDAAPQAEASVPESDDPIEAEVLKLMRGGKKIAAVKYYRENKPGCGLKDAKDAVEAIAAQHGVTGSQQSGCATAVLLIAAVTVGLWWL